MRVLFTLRERCKHKDSIQDYDMLQLICLILAVIGCCRGCPEKCLCLSQTVKCQNQDLDNIPHSLPTNTKVLLLTGNSISRLSVDSFPSLLDQLTDLYLGGNELEFVDAMAFDKLPNLVRLDLNNNSITNFSDQAFPDDNKLQVLNLSRCFQNHSLADLSFLPRGNLQQLSVLDLSNNDLVFLPDNIFTGLPNLENLSLQNSSIISIQNGTLNVPPLQNMDLRDNSLRLLPTITMSEFSSKPGLHIRLAGNPWHCDCFIEDSISWLKNSTQVTDVQNLTCANPEELRHLPLLQIQHSQLKCSGNMEGVLETSYVFLGLVLALIGVIFLLVLYLNRKGIKRWIYNIRDACRDHMEGYHYRYEINSDPRMANLSINSDV
uniref:Trophoblast glycoprotein b n=1 Tax=Neogobius melanostomus TaxID=47308 RepID=A0A8C6SXB2_9GOBI